MEDIAQESKDIKEKEQIEKWTITLYILILFLQFIY